MAWANAIVHTDMQVHFLNVKFTGGWCMYSRLVQNSLLNLLHNLMQQSDIGKTIRHIIRNLCTFKFLSICAEDQTYRIDG